MFGAPPFSEGRAFHEGFALEYRRLGKTELKASVLGFGCAQIASMSTTYPRREVTATLRAALEQSVNFFDTADIYGQGDSERLLGEIVCGRREDAIICTKAGLTLGTPQLALRLLKPFVNPLMRSWGRGRDTAVRLRKSSERQCFDPAYIRRRIEGSLRRLKTDYIDLFLLHNPPPEVLEQGELFGMLERLRQNGILRHYGISCRALQEARLSLRVEGVSCLQLDFNLCAGADADDFLRQAMEQDVGIIAREVFGGGVILKNPAVKRVVDTTEGRRTPAEMALKWVQRQPAVGVIVVGMSCRRHLKSNIAALESTALSEMEVEALSKLRPLALEFGS